jgi:hypothetical protein
LSREFIIFGDFMHIASARIRDVFDENDCGWLMPDQHSTHGKANFVLVPVTGDYPGSAN